MAIVAHSVGSILDNRPFHCLLFPVLALPIEGPVTMDFESPQALVTELIWAQAQGL